MSVVRRVTSARALSVLVLLVMVLLGVAPLAHAAPAAPGTTTAPTTTLTTGGVAAGGVAAGAAPAADTPAPAGWCADPPTAQGNADTVTGTFDILAPASPGGTGLYSRYGWTGWDTTVYDPGCLDRVLSWVGDVTGPLSTPGVLGAGISESTGVNRVTGWFVGLSVFVLGALVTLVRLAVGPAGMWDVLDSVEKTVLDVAGSGFLVTFLGIGLALTGLWFMWRSRSDPLGVVLSQAWTAFLLLVAGIAVTIFQVTAGPSVDGAIQQTYTAAGQVAAGQVEGRGAPGDGPDPGTVIADAVTDHVLLPAWGVIHLGPDMGAVSTYAERLYAAGAMTRQESARAQADPAVKQQLVQAKRRDYKAVAEEIRTTHPGAYEVLMGRDADRRLPWAALLFVLVVMIAAVTGIAAAIVAFSRVGLRLLVAASPAIAVVTQHPVLQRYGLLAVQWILKLVWASVLATAFLITFVRVVILVLGSGRSWIEVMIAVVVLCSVLLWIWNRRADIARRAGLLEQQRAMERSASAARDAAVWSATQAGTAAGGVATYLRDRHDRRTDPDAVVPADVTERATAPAELVAGAASPQIVRSVVVDRHDALALESRKATSADPVTVPRKADRADVSAVAARLAATRPSEASLAVRERAELAARTARRATPTMPATPAGPVTRVADRAAVHAVRTAGVKGATRLAATGAVRAAAGPGAPVATAAAVVTKVRR